MLSDLKAAALPGLLLGAAAAFVWGAVTLVGAVERRDAARDKAAYERGLKDARAEGLAGVAHELAAALKTTKADQQTLAVARLRLDNAVAAAEARQRAALDALNKDPAYAECGRQKLPAAARLHPYLGLRDPPTLGSNPGDHRDQDRGADSPGGL